MGWLTGWLKRKKSSILGSTAGAQTLYQVKAKVHYGAGTDGSPNANDVYCNSSCETNFGDIRWTEDDGITEMDYWIEEKVDSDYAIFWIEMPSIPADPSFEDIFIYYDKSGASTTEDGEATFPELFDHFGGSAVDTDIWEGTGTGEPVSGSEVTISVVSGQRRYINTKLGASVGRAVRMKMKWNNTGGASGGMCGWASGWEPQDNSECLAGGYAANPTTSYRFYTRTGGGGTYSDFTCTDLLSYSVIEIQRIATTAGKVYQDDGLLGQRTANISTASLDIYLGACCHDGNKVIVDWVLIRRIASPEPTWGTWYGESKVFQESYEASDELVPCFVLDKEDYSPLIDFRTTDSKKVVSFSVPRKKGYILQRVGDDVKTLTLTGYLISTSADPDLRETKRRKLDRAKAYGERVKFEIEGEGTFVAIIRSISFDDIEGEPNSYRYVIEAVQVSYSDYSDHSNISYLDSTPHTDYAYSDHDDYSDSVHTDHSDHSDVSHSDSNPYSDSYSDWDEHSNTSHTNVDWNDTASQHVDGDVSNGHSNHSDSAAHGNYTDTYYYYGWEDSWIVNWGRTYSEAASHTDWTDAYSGTEGDGDIHWDHTDYSDSGPTHVDDHSNWSDHNNTPHADFSHDDISHSDWEDHNDIEHSDWENHSDGYGDWNNHTDSEG